jgi:hypothetical protein
MDALPTPVVVPPTATRPRPTETLEIPATFTPEPTATPTLALGARITGLLTVDGQPLWAGTGLGVGPGLFLQRCPAQGPCTFVGRTAVDATGRYSFTVDGALAPGEAYQIAWWNSSEVVQGIQLEGAPLYLGRWLSRRITDLQPEQVLELPAVDLGDIVLLSPTAGTGFYGFPIPFSWAAWPGDAVTYKWSLCKCCQTKQQRDGSYKEDSESAGAATSFQLTGMPRGFRFDERYCWYIHANMGAEKGFGESFAVRMMWFLESPPFAGLADQPPRCGS